MLRLPSCFRAFATALFAPLLAIFALVTPAPAVTLNNPTLSSSGGCGLGSPTWFIVSISVAAADVPNQDRLIDAGSGNTYWMDATVFYTVDSAGVIIGRQVMEFHSNESVSGTVFFNVSKRPTVEGPISVYLVDETDLTPDQALGGSFNPINILGSLPGFDAASLDPNCVPLETIAPTVTISSSAPAVVNGPFEVTATFSEPVTGQILSAFTVTNGTASTLVSSGNDHTVTIHPGVQGPVYVWIPAGVVMDASGNGNEVSNTLSRVYDSAPPVPQMSAATADPTNTDRLPVTLNFNEEVTGLTAATLETENATIEGFTSSNGGRTYTFDLLPQVDGTFRVSLLSGAVQDLAGNLNMASATVERISDRTGPLIIADPVLQVSTSSSFTVMPLSISEPLRSAQTSDFTCTNGTWTVFATGMGALTMAATSDGLVSCTFGVNFLQDYAGNPMQAPVTYSFYYDAHPPGVTLSSSTPNLTSANPIPVTATFSEPVTGFDLGDISVSGGSPANLNGSGAVYTFDVIPSVQEGPITISIAAGVAEDPAGRTNTAATPLSRSYDGSRPMGTILSDSDPLTSERRIPMRIEFSEEVTDFALSDLTIVNGRVENLGGASPVFTFDLIPEADGEVLVDLPENRVSDLAGNGNTASTRFTLTFDGTPPGVEIASSAPAVTNLVQIPVTVTFSEDVSGFDASDLVLGNATAEDFTGSNASYSFTLIPGGDGTVTVDIAAAAAEDAAGNPSTAALQFSRDFDGTGPGVTLTSAAPPVTNAPIPVTITFSKPVTGFGVEDLVVGNATPSGLSGTGAAYTVLLTPIADGPVTLDIAADAAFDSLGNGNSAALQLTRNFDAGQPSVTISSPSSPVSSDNPILVQVLFDKPVTGFEAADLVLGNARIRDFSGAGTQYDVVLIPEGDGAVTVDIPAGVAVDAAGNGNLAAPQFLRIYDGTPPIGTLATTATSPTLLNPIPVTVSFDEPVFGFDAGDLSVVNGSIANFAGSGTAYSFDLVPAADGEVTVRIQAGAAVNEAGLSNPASELLTVIFDGTLPGVTLATTVSLPTNLPVIPVTASFTEPVTGFDVTDLVIANGTAGNFAGQGAEYSFDLIPSGDGTVTVDIPAGAARDLTGNGNTPALQLALIHDATRPGVTLSGTPAPVGTPYPVTVTFSEPVTGLDLADFTVTGAALSNLAGSGRDYTLTVTASAAGHSLQLPEGVVQDAAGNGNLASNLFENAAPTDGPGLEITGLPESFSPGDRFTVTFTFSAPVRGFEPDDILVTNGTISALSGGPAVYAATLVPDGKGSLSVQVPLGAAEDANGMGSQAAMVSATLVVTREASKAINDFLQFRARSLVQNQAGLTGFVNGRGTGQITASTSGTGLTFDIHSGVKNETWFALSGSFTRAEDGGEMDYALVTIGTHRPIGRNAILGVMLQYDQSDMTTSGGIAVEGKGWLVGPYIAGQIQDQPIWYEGRLLYGRTDNRISPTGTFTDDFSGERWLAQFAVEGQFLMDRGVILYPSFTLSHVSETQFAYTDGLSGAVPGQRVALTEAAFGMDLEFPVRIARGELTLLAGISGILSSLQGDDTASAYFGEKSDSRGRLDLGLRYSNGAGLTASFAGFFDGIGSSFETTGLDAKVALEF